MENQILYHATSMESFFSIMDSGELKPQAVSISDWAKKEKIEHYFNGNEEEYNKHISNYTGYTFFATNQYSAQRYGNRAADKSNIKNMYIIIVTQLLEENLLPDLNDASDSTTWQESAREAGQVRVLGSVRVVETTELIIVLRDLHITINTTASNWKKDLKAEMAKQVRSGFLDADDCYEMWDKLGIAHANK